MKKNFKTSVLFGSVLLALSSMAHASSSDSSTAPTSRYDKWYNYQSQAASSGPILTYGNATISDSYNNQQGFVVVCNKDYEHTLINTTAGEANTVGCGSMAYGNFNNAQHLGSVVFGYGNTASDQDGQFSVVVGRKNALSGYSVLSSVFGQQNNISFPNPEDLANQRENKSLVVGDFNNLVNPGGTSVFGKSNFMNNVTDSLVTGSLNDINNASFATIVGNGNMAANGGVANTMIGVANNLRSAANFNTIVGYSNSSSQNGGGYNVQIGYGTTVLDTAAEPLNNSVAIGSYSVVKKVPATPSATIAGTEYQFAGANPYGYVSFGVPSVQIGGQTVAVERILTNVAAGRLASTSTDAVNGSQLFSTNQAVGDLKTSLSSYALASDLTALKTQVDNLSNAGTGTSSGSTPDTSTTTPEPDTTSYTVYNAKDKTTTTETGAQSAITKINESVKYIAENSDTTALASEQATMKADITAVQGNVSTIQSDLTSVRSDVGAMRNDISALQNDMGALRGDVQSLKKDYRALRKDAFAGTAAALAVASLPMATDPGKSMVAMAGGSFKGQTAMAIGISKRSQNSKFTFRANGSVNSRGDFGIGLGAGYQW